MADINDYLIQQDGKDWNELLSGWTGLMAEEFTLWMVNRFGDLIITYDDGSVHFLDVGSGTLAKLADSQDQFVERVDHEGNAANWFMIPLVDDCVAAGMTLLPNQCYGYKIPPFLGGAYNVDNCEPTDMSVHYAFLADIWRQTKDLPDGTKIKAVVIE